MHTWPALDIQQADDDDLIHAFLIDFHLAAIDGSRFYFHADNDRDRAAEALGVRFAGIEVYPVDVADEDWAARSQAAVRAVQIRDIIVAPPWDVPRPVTPSPRDAGAGSIEPTLIVIQPSMGFGTGHHATTRLCLRALQQIDLRDR